MMKKMMVALAALTLVGVANAATMIWHWAPNGSADEVEASTTFNMVVSDVRLSVAQAVLAVNPDYDTSELTGDTSTPQGTVTVIGDDHLISLTDGESQSRSRIPPLGGVLKSTSARMASIATWSSSVSRMEPLRSSPATE